MSRLVDIKSEELWQILFDEACVEGRQAERIENELNKISVNEKEIRSKAIDEFAERLKDFIAKNVEDAEVSNDLCCEIFQSEIDEIAEQLKGGAE